MQKRKLFCSFYRNKSRTVLDRMLILFNVVLSGQKLFLLESFVNFSNNILRDNANDFQDLFVLKEQ